MALAALLLVLPLIGATPAQDPLPAGEGPAAASEATAPTPTKALDGEPIAEHLARWLEEVEPLITAAERRMFESLKRNYQREAFIQAFWRVRDPYPRTARNELKDRWPIRVAEARARFGTLEDDRARLLLVHDRPSRTFEVNCTANVTNAAVWVYDHGSLLADFPFVIVFMRFDRQRPMVIWRPGAGFATQQTMQRVRPCRNGSLLSQVVAQISRNLDAYERALSRVLAKPRPRSQEWIQTFVAQSTEMPAGARTIAGTVGFSFPGRYQNRTVVQGTVSLPASEVTVGEFAGYRSRDLQLTGELIRDDTLFETFRYKYGIPAADGDATAGESARLPLAFQRYLRPGTYRLIMRVDDLNDGGVFRIEQPLEVPTVETAFLPLDQQDPLTATLYAEAIAAIEAGETSIKIREPPGELLTGFVSFDTVVGGEEIAKVRFLLDDKPVLTKNRPPFDVRLDLGPHPDLHVLRVEGLDAEGHEVASDEVLINGGGYRFAIKLIEPRRGRRYDKSLRVRCEVEVPEDRSLDRIELFLDDRLVATLYQEPFVHPLVLPEDRPVTYVRAVAYLPDGNATEDLVFINAPELGETLEVQLVELYTTVLDAAGRPVEDLGKEDFTVREDGVPQTVSRFERVESLPIHVGILIDNSASMHGVLDDVRKAALSFFQQAITPRDRAAVITFNSFPNLTVKLTSDRAALGRGLAGLVAEGQTALYDSVMFALYYFTGIRGQRAILVLSDGKDESSRFDFDQTLDYARRAGITIYTIGFRLHDPGPRRRLGRLADETGGRSFFIGDIAELEEVYGLVQRELRSQYLIAYQSSNTGDDDAFRSVELMVDRPDVTVKTLSGYYP